MGCFLNYLDNWMTTVGAEQRFRPQQHAGGNVGAEQRFRPQQRISSASVADVMLGSVTSYIGTSQSGSLPFWPRADSFSAERVIFP